MIWAKLVTRCGCSRLERVSAEFVRSGFILLPLDTDDFTPAHTLPDRSQREFRFERAEPRLVGEPTYIFKEVIT